MAKPGADEQTDLGGGRRGDSSPLKTQAISPSLQREWQWDQVAASASGRMWLGA